MKSDFYTLSTYTKAGFISALLVQACASVTCFALAYGYQDSDCKNSVRNLLLANMVITCVLFFLTLCLTRSGFFIWTVWNIVFICISLSWTFGDDSCQFDFSFGFSLLALLGVISVFMIFLICCSSCIAGIALCIGYSLMSNYEPLD